MNCPQMNSKEYYEKNWAELIGLNARYTSYLVNVADGNSREVDLRQGLCRRVNSCHNR